LWEDAGITEEIPTVDFDREVVVRYTHAVSGTCPEINLEGVGVGGLTFTRPSGSVTLVSHASITNTSELEYIRIYAPDRGCQRGGWTTSGAHRQGNCGARH
jgi:hypothetical protein